MSLFKKKKRPRCRETFVIVPLLFLTAAAEMTAYLFCEHAASTALTYFRPHKNPVLTRVPHPSSVSYKNRYPAAFSTLTPPVDFL